MINSPSMGLGNGQRAWILPTMLCCAVVASLDVHARAAESADEFAGMVRPFLEQHCVTCHGPGGAEAELRIDRLDPDLAAGRDAEMWNRVRFRLLADEMPPVDEPRPPADSSTRVIRWLTDELRAAGVTPLDPDGFHLPSAGNRIDHDLLFSGAVDGPAATPARLWRMGPYLYDSRHRETAKNARGVVQPFSGLSEPGFQDYAAAFSIDEPTTAQLLRNADAIVAAQTRGELQDGTWHAPGYPQPVKEIVRLFEAENQPLTPELQRQAITRQFQLILQREPTDEEFDRYRELMDKCIAETDLQLGVRTTMAAVLLTPEAVFRFELGVGQPDEFGRRFLAPRELAHAIAFALTDRRPDGDLTRAAAENRLVTAEDVDREVWRILEADQIAKPRLLRFFEEYFGYRAAPEVFKDKELNPHHRADVLVRDTQSLIEWILARDQYVLFELLTTNRSFVNWLHDENRDEVRPAQPKNLIHVSYGLPVDWKWTAEQPIQLSAQERAGILTQPSWLVANSSNFDNHPILRGKWIRERLLGGVIPDLPITVDAQLPDEPEHVLRERMRVTREEYCWNCHQQMNPLGLPFETYDHFGRFRTVELVLDRDATLSNVDDRGRPLGDVHRRIPVDATGGIARSGDPDLDGDCNDAVEMIHRLARSDRVRQVFIRHAFRYFLGRNEQLSDSPTLIAADEAYVNSGGSFQALVASLLTSDSFLYRIEEPSEAAADRD